MQQAQPSAGQVAFNAANKPVGWIPKKTVRVLLDDDMNTGIAIYCVNCTVHAYFDASGSIDFSLAHGPTDGHFVLTGDFLLSRYLGIDAMYTGNFTLLDERLVEVGIPGFQIPGIVVVGPSITVNMKLGMEVKAQGQLLAGHEISMPNAIAVLDLMDSTKSYFSGWSPTHKKTFDVHGELSVGWAFEMPIGLGIGVSMLKGKWEKKVALINTPSLNYDAEIAVDFKYSSIILPDGSKIVKSTPLGNIAQGICPGIQAGLSFQDRLEANLLGITAKTLWFTTKTLASDCITLWDKPAATPAPASSYEYLGCFENLFKPALVISVSSSQGSTRATCEEACTGHLYYGLGYSNLCICANSAPRAPLLSTACTLACTGDSSQICGGLVSLSVYTYKSAEYALRATGKGLKYWAWNTFAPQDDGGLYVNVPALANSNWRYAGTVENVNSLTTSWSSPFYLITLPGQSTSVIGSQMTVNMQGYFIPKLSGSYHFAPVKYDNKFLMWAGPQAHTNYGYTNAVINQWGWQEAPKPTTLIVKAGQLVPVTLMWINFSGPGNFVIQITDPIGNTFISTTDMFMNDPNASINDGKYNSFVKRDSVESPSPVLAARAPGITEPPLLTELHQVSKRTIDVIGGPADNLPNTGTSAVTLANGDYGTVSGPLAAMGVVPPGFNFSAQAGYPDTNSSQYVWPTPSQSLDQWNAAIGNPLASDRPGTNSTSPDDPTFYYANILDATGTLQLHTGADHNLYLSAADPSDASALYAGRGNVYASDSSGNLLVYYADELSVLGVSRFRAVPPEAFPATARMAALAPFETAERQWVYAVVDTIDTVLYPVYCNFARGKPSRLFLVKDLDAGIEVLVENLKLKWFVTGGVVQECGPVALMAAGPAYVDSDNS